MKRGSTLFLRMAVFLIGAPVLALGIFGIYYLLKNPANPDYAHILYPIVIGMYISVIPFFGALFQAFKLLSYIDKNEAFSDLSVSSSKENQTLCNNNQWAVCVDFAICLCRSRAR